MIRTYRIYKYVKFVDGINNDLANKAVADLTNGVVDAGKNFKLVAEVDAVKGFSNKRILF